MADFPPRPLISICHVRVDLTKLILNHLLAVFDICHPLTAPSFFLHCLSLYLSFPNFPESETTKTFHQRHSQYCSWHLQSRTEDIGAWVSGWWRYCVCVYVRRPVEKQQTWTEWVFAVASEVWLPKAISHSFISIILVFSLKPCCSSLGSTMSPSLCSLHWPPAWFFLLPQGVPVCVINKIVSTNLQTSSFFFYMFLLNAV